MDYEKIKLATLDVYKKCGIKSFPVDCIETLHFYGMKIETYSEQKPIKHKKCLTYSGDAFSLKKKIYYNDSKSTGRIRFSLAHEIGHIALKHKTPGSDEQEDEADCFASYFLAPRMAIHYAKCKNQNDVAKIFNLSQEASQYAFDDYKRWYRWTIYHKMNAFDKAMYQYFYNEEPECFVYSIKKCASCGKEIFNTSSIMCEQCKVPRRTFISYEQSSDDLLIAENHWLYRGL